ncbi:MAG: hypothetical protein KBS68_06920 [Clostridiales bacterium]|nr:hypothetical protein [Candidatus Crickella merdequi]
MKRRNALRDLIFLTLCCDLGLFGKRIIAPVANIVTDALHIPGGIGTSFSLMFLVIAAFLIHGRGCATLMGVIQSGLALAMGMIGSMGALSPIGYIVPGMVIDLVVLLYRRFGWQTGSAMVVANMLGAATASLVANVIVFKLHGAALGLYVSVALLSGALFGWLGYVLEERLKAVVAYGE